MNKLQEQIKTQIVDPAIKQIQNTIVGHVMCMYSDHMVADVSVDNPFGPGVLKLEKVPIQLGSGGFSQAGPFMGDKVVVTFKNFNPNTPVITALLDTNHKSTTQEQRFKSERKGTYVPDGICKRSGWEYPKGLW